jgi:O-antigen ligase
VPWHIDNLYLELVIERGLPACVAFVLCMGFALRRLVGAVGREVAVAPFLAASLCGAMCVGLVSSLMDVPRVAFLLFLLTLFAVEITAAVRPVGHLERAA